ncbi:MAG: hypothetical protein JXA81_00450 [Sedimentisphaerales bacterium]|nr:hypothetical protein [Sedimentisphaerales bacterium]
MKRYLVLIGIILSVLIAALNAFGQDEEKAGRTEQQQNIRERVRNMSPQEREKLRAEIEQRRKRFENMSDEERAKLREQMRERDGSRPAGVSRDEQIKAIKTIEAQVAKLKAAVEVAMPEDRSQLRELSQEDRTKLREKMMTAMRERQMAIRAIEQELAKLRGPSRPETVSEARLSELRAIHRLAVKEKATQTADRLDKLIMGIQRGSADRERRVSESPERTRRERPARREKTE